MNIQNIITNEDTTWLTVNGVDYGLGLNQLLDADGIPYFNNIDPETSLNFYEIVAGLAKQSEVGKNLITQGIIAKIESEDISYLENSAEINQHIDDLVTDYFNDFEIESSEDALCEFIGLDNFHAVRDAQNQR